ncbi:MAG: leucine-rich repeat protein [Prevotella sp.]|nr:leucine-rich repeat protein [Prevotella sp.]
MKKIKFLLAAMMAIVSVPRVWAVDGDRFTAQTEDGVTLTFKVISETLQTCEVSTNCIDATYTGAVTVPATANGYAVTKIGNYAFIETNVGSITLPNSIVAIGKGAFSYTHNLQTMTIPSGVTDFGEGETFIYSESLQSVVVSEGVTTIPDDFVNQCRALTSVSIPEGVTSIGVTAFGGCTALTEVVIPSTVTNIGENAFVQTGLQRIEVKNPTPIEINADCFTPRYAYATLVVPFGSMVDYQGAAVWSNFNQMDDHSVFKANTAEGVEVTYKMLSETACQVGDGTNRAISTSYSGAVTIPESVNGITVIAIGDYAFRACSLTEISLPATLNSIGNNSVASCSNLTKVIANMTDPFDIDDTSFSLSLQADLYVEYASLDAYKAHIQWKKFHRIIPFSSDPTIIIDVNADGSLYTFYKVISESDKTCQVGLGQEGSTAIPTTYAGDFTIPSSVNGYTVTKVGAYAFKGCSGITAMILPEGIKEIGDYAFANATAMTSISLPESLEIIGTGAFRYSGLTAVELPENSLNLGSAAFMGCSQLASVKLPSQITVLPNYLFENCYRLESIVIPNNVNTIGSSCFCNTALTSVLLPESLGSLGRSSFDCANLTTVVSPLKQPISIYDDTFSNRTNATLYVPVGWKNNYNVALYWKEFDKIVDDDMVSMSPENIVIHFRVISEEDKTCEVYRGENTAAIDGYNTAHEGAVYVQVTVPASVQGYTVTRIGQHAFYGCTQMTGINLPSTIKEIGYQAFYGAGLRGGTFVLPEGLNHLDDHAFESSNVDNVILPSTLTAISNYAFKGDPFNTFIIPNTVESIGTQAFNQQGITGVTVVTVFRSTPLPIDADCFTPNSHSTLYVPAGSKAAYEQATGWNKFSNIVELDMGGSTGVKGDVNGDGSVTISDVTKVVSIILDSPSSATE